MATKKLNRWLICYSCRRQGADGVRFINDVIAKHPLAWIVETQAKYHMEEYAVVFALPITSAQYKKYKDFIG